MNIQPAQICAVCNRNCLIGEGPLWWNERRRLVQKDSFRNVIMLININDGSYESFNLNPEPGCFGLTQSGELIGACGQNICIVEPDHTLRPLHPPVKLMAKIFNDGKTGPDGNFYAGTIYGDNDELGGLYMLDGAGNLHLVYEGLYLSNGLDWSPDGKTMYLVDVGVILAFDFQTDGKPLSRPRILMKFSDLGIGNPDGMCVDSQGNIWAALWGSGIARIDPIKREITHLIQLPTKQVASCAFVGNHFERLAVTTATYPSETPANPADGRTYILDVGVSGRPPYRYSAASH